LDQDKGFEVNLFIFFSIKQDVAFVVDGWALEIALKHYRKAFTELAVLSRTAICCRVTPSQKAQVFF
jgi:magnesium-transporting ATPase (P-type)